MSDKEQVIIDALEIMCVDRDSLIKVGENLFVNKCVDPKLTELRCISFEYWGEREEYDGSYTDFDWVLNDPCFEDTDLFSLEEIEDKSIFDVDSPEAYNLDYGGCMSNFNRRKFRQVLEKIFSVYDRSKFALNVVFATSDDICKTDILMVQAAEKSLKWIHL